MRLCEDGCWVSTKGEQGEQKGRAEGSALWLAFFFQPTHKVSPAQKNATVTCLGSLIGSHITCTVISYETSIILLFQFKPDKVKYLKAASQMEAMSPKGSDVV